MRITPYFLILALCCFNFSIGQEQNMLLKGRVKNDNLDTFMASVHVLNLSSVEGVSTNTEGEFEIAAKAQDTLYFSYLGFKPLRFR